MNKRTTKSSPIKVCFCIAVFIAGLCLGVLWHRLRIFPFPQLSAANQQQENKEELSIPGRWRERMQKTDNLTDEQKKMIGQLRSVGYLAGSQPVSDLKQVTLYDRERAFDGLNLVISGHAPEAILMDMEGNELHKWACDIFRVWPDLKVEKAQQPTFWRRVHLLQDGDLLAIFDGIGMIKLDRNSNLIWSVKNGAHHDLYVSQNGEISVLTRRAYINEEFNDQKPILEDFICVLDSNGNQIEEISILEALKTSSYAPLMTRVKEWGDIFHSNTIERIDKDLSGLNPAFRRGRFLISILYLDLVCVIDGQKGVVWGESDLWARQHQPTLLDNGHLLVFDNKGLYRQSRVIEFDPVTGQIHWLYGGDANERFYTPTCGSCQRLPNGNTLITESDPGRAFEVTPDKSIVWEYVNPHTAGEQDEYIATLFEVVRLSSEFSTDGW